MDLITQMVRLSSGIPPAPPLERPSRLPKVELGNFKTLEIERPVAAASDADIEPRLKELAESAQTFTPRSIG